MIDYLSKIIEEEYNSDWKIDYSTKTPVENILRYLAVEKVINNDEDRVKYDVDAYYYKNHAVKGDGVKYTIKEACHGDVLFSFWMPFQLAVFLINKKSFMYYKLSLHKEYYGKKQIDRLFGDECFEQVREMFTKFAGLCFTNGNFVLLPNRDMQKRGVLYEDRVDKTLFECFPNGTLSEYFSNNEEILSDWIRREHLEVLFKYGDIARESVLPLVEPSKFTNFYMSLDGIREYIDNAVRIITIRNKLLAESTEIGI